LTTLRIDGGTVVTMSHARAPLFNEISHLVYSARASDVDTVLINGKTVMENREITTIDVHKVLEMAEKTKEKLLARLQSTTNNL